MNWLFYSTFLKERAKDLRRIASQTGGDKTAEDLGGDALLMAEYFGAKRGFEIDWLDPKDQDLILGRLYAENVTRKKGERRRAVSADRDIEDHEGNAVTLIDLLPAEATADPLALLERREEEEKERARKEEEEAFLESYSQSVAYVIVLWLFDNIRTRAAAYLVIDRGTLRKRIAFAAKSLKVQPSLFDRIERIDEAFTPAPGRQYAVMAEPSYEAIQWRWEF